MRKSNTIPCLLGEKEGMVLKSRLVPVVSLSVSRLAKGDSPQKSSWTDIHHSIKLTGKSLFLTINPGGSEDEGDQELKNMHELCLFGIYFSID